MRLLGNILWFLFGGLLMGLGWWLAGALAYLSIVGIPWGRACFVIAELAFFPFGKDIVDRRLVTGQDDVGTGPLGLVGNILWFLCLGFGLALGHVVSALGCFVTLIGIPFGLQHLKLALLALAPIGKSVVEASAYRSPWALRRA